MIAPLKAETAPSMQSLRSIASPLVALLSVALTAVLLLAAGPARAQDDDATPAPIPGRMAPGVHPPRKGPGGVRPLVHTNGGQQFNPNSAQFNPNGAGGNGAPASTPAAASNRPSIASEGSEGSRVITPNAAVPRKGGPPAPEAGDKKLSGSNAKLWSLSFDKRDLAEVIQQVADITQRNFILPERVSGKITILTNTPVPAEEVWSVFLAALDANNWAVYPIGHYWKLSEKKQSSRANIPTYLEPGEEPSPNEQMVTKLFKLHYVDADQMRNTINQFTTRDSDFQIFPPDTLIISDLGINMRRLQRLIDTLDQPGGSEEIHIVQAQYGTAAELATKLTEIFAAQATKSPGGQRQLGVAEGNGMPAMPGVPPNPNIPGGGANAASNGPLSVSKVIAEDRTNKLIIIAGAKSFQRVLDLLRQIDVPGGENGVHVYYLDNAKAEDVATTMQSLAQGVSGKKKTGAVPGAPSGLNAASGGADLFTGDVKITADKNTNSLVIVASTSDYRNVLKVIQQLDIPRRQVFVEAVIMEISLEDDLNMGASLHGGKLVTSGTSQLPLVFGSELGSLNSLGGVTSLASLNGFLAGIQGPPLTIPGTSLSIPSFAILVNALQSSSDVNVISTPTVTMTDNSEGEITVGQNVPFQAGYSPGGGLSSLASAAGASGSATSSLLGSSIGLGGLSSLYAPIQRQNVELRLKIKPQINQGEYVRLEVDEQTEEIASTDPTLGPTTSKRSAKTTVLAKDQETVVIGGLIQERTIKGVSKTPILGSIPVLGWLFRNETSKKTKTNLLLFLTPYIIRDQSDYRRIFERKMAERAEFVKRFTGADANYVAAIDYGRKASPLARLSRTVDIEMNRVENGGPGISGERAILPSGSLPPPRFAAPPVDNTQPSAPVNQQTWPAGSPTPAATKPAASRQPGSRPPSESAVSDPGGVVAEPPPPTLPDIPAPREPGSVPPDVGPDERAPASGVIRPGTSTDTKP